MHSMKTVDGKESNTAKRVNIVTDLISLKTLYLIKKWSDTKWGEFKVRKHKIGTYEINKISLLCFDDKRFVLDDGIHTLAYFHKDLKKFILTNDHKKKRILQRRRIQKYFTKRRDSHR